MAKVICAVLRYTEDQKSLIIEHEKLRHAVSYLNKSHNFKILKFYLALAKLNKIRFSYFQTILNFIS